MLREQLVVSFFFHSFFPEYPRDIFALVEKSELLFKL